MRIAVVGATGRLGALAVRLVSESDDLQLHASIGRSDSLDEIAGADVVFDATRFEVSQQLVATAQRHGIPAVIGTSGWSAERIAALGRVSAPVVIVPNFSLGSVLATALSAMAAPYFETVEIVETHPLTKLDSPSGTATRTAEVIAAAREATLSGEQGASIPAQPARGQLVAGIPVHSLRELGVIAEQRVELGRSGERLRIEHVTTSNESYADGILLAVRRAPGLHGVTVGLDALLDLPGRA